LAPREKPQKFLVFFSGFCYRFAKRVSFSFAQQNLEHYLGIMEEYEFELLDFSELPEAHFVFQFDTNPHSLFEKHVVKTPVKPVYTSTSSAKLTVACSSAAGLTFATLLFDDENPTALVSEKTASTIDMMASAITIHFPVKHFAGIYTMLQEAFSKQKLSIKLKVFGKDSLWGARLDFIPK